jgi:hypothetical protein
MRGGVWFLLILLWSRDCEGLQSRYMAAPFLLSWNPFKSSLKGSWNAIRGGNGVTGALGQKISSNLLPLTEEIVSNKIKVYERVISLSSSIDLLNLQKINLEKLFQRVLDNWSSGTDEIRIVKKVVEIKTTNALLGKTSLSLHMRTLASENQFSILLEVIPQQKTRGKDRDESSSILIQLTHPSPSSPSMIEMTYAVSSLLLLLLTPLSAPRSWQATLNFN